ncbi:MAG: hypothetical protein HQ512_11630 [Rhodospirillales bacterium]|nr:hypothetical protein [Rhodospirillales bacterium]
MDSSRITQRPDKGHEIREAPAPGDWPSFAEIREPAMVGLHVGNGSASKPFQAYLDGHPQVYMLPAYPLIYFYPHWEDWKEKFKDTWDWSSIIDAFCTQHASVIDTRRIPGFNGLTGLGETQDQHLEIDEGLFRAFLAHLLDGRPIRSRTFLLAIHYAFAFCNGEDLNRKSVLVFHIHVPEYISRYLAVDFPDLKTIGCVRDPRSNIGGRFYNSFINVDDQQFNRTDAAVYRRRTYCLVCSHLYTGLEAVRGLDPQKTKVFRAEDLHHRRAELMDSVAEFLGIDKDSCFESFTFGGLLWWGDAVYNMNPLNEFNPRVVSDSWKKEISAVDWFVLEGLFYDYFRKFGYTSFKYRSDSFLNRLLLFTALFIPSQFERRIILGYLNPKSVIGFIAACYAESSGGTPLKDYSFSASYRHKITTRDLKMWKPRWYATLVRRIQQFSEENPDSSLIAPFRWLGIVIYTAANLCRYVFSLLLMPVMFARRLRLMLAAFWQRLTNSNSLPDYL